MIGIFLRCIHLNQKPYWFDETYTMLRVSGYSAQEVEEALFTGQVVQAGDFLKYQAPASEQGIAGTIAGLAQEEPQLPPLYFLAAKLWANCFGSSKAAMRSFSVMGSLLSFPLLHWLCLDLFASSTMGWMAMALFAVSPISLRYAQEIRQYSFWLTLILLTCVLLLRAIRQPTKMNWGLYTLSAIATLYCHLLSILVFIAQGLYVWGVEGYCLSKAVRSYGIAFGISIACLLPWIWAIWQNRSSAIKMLAWSSTPLPLSNLIQGTAASLTHFFFIWPLQYHYPLIYLAIPIVLLLFYALHFLYAQAPIRPRLLILFMIGVTALPFLGADLILGGRRCLSERYFFATHAGIVLALAYLLTIKLIINKLTIKLMSQPVHFKVRVWQWITGLLISGSILSCIVGSLSQTWWGWSEFDVKTSSIIHEVSHPLVVSDMPLGLVLPIARELQPQTNMQLMTSNIQENFDFPAEFSHVFLYSPSDRLLAFVKQQYGEPELVYHFRDPATTVQFSLYRIHNSHNS